MNNNSAQNNGLGMYDLGVTKLFQKVLPLEKQLALADKLETTLKNNLSINKLL